MKKILNTTSTPDTSTYTEDSNIETRRIEGSKSFNMEKYDMFEKDKYTIESLIEHLKELPKDAIIVRGSIDMKLSNMQLTIRL